MRLVHSIEVLINQAMPHTACPGSQSLNEVVHSIEVLINQAMPHTLTGGPGSQPLNEASTFYGGSD